MGKAEAMLLLGGPVTIMRLTADAPPSVSADLTTLTGVKTGDNLTAGG